jgi:hypothetical protein
LAHSLKTGNSAKSLAHCPHTTDNSAKESQAHSCPHTGNSAKSLAHSSTYR